MLRARPGAPPPSPPAAGPPGGGAFRLRDAQPGAKPPAQAFPASRLRLGQMGGIFGEAGVGPATLAVVTRLEALLFGARPAAATTWARRR